MRISAQVNDRNKPRYLPSKPL